jgi:hypothetical protein
MLLKFVIVLFIICIEVSTAFALPALTFSPVSIVGTTASFAITLTNSVGTTISGLSTDIEFNPLVFKLQTNTSGDVTNITAGAAATSAGKQIYTSNPAPGVLRIGIFGLGVAPISNGPVAQVNFTVIDSANQGNQSFTNSPGASSSMGSAVVIVGTGITTAPPTAVNGTCGISNEKTFPAVPTAGFCIAGTASTLTGSGPWSWSCDGLYGGTNTACTAKVAPVNGTCGLSNGKSFTVAPTTSICTDGTASAVTGTGPWSWSCDGLYGGTNTACTAKVAPVNGVCGISNGKNFTAVPSADLCTTGTASTITGTGPWSWSCDGANTGTNANCTANATYGLISNNGVAELKDALFILQSVVGTLKLTSEEHQRADINDDGRVDVGDAILILAKVVGL